MSWIFKPLALASTLALSTLGILSRKYQKARFIYHLTLYVSTLGVVSVWGVIVSILATVAGQRLNINYLVARSFYHVCSPLVGIRFEVEGEEHLTKLLTSREGKPQSAVLLSNHQSFLDILYLGRAFPKRASIMAKQELKWSPFLGQFMALSGAIFVDRKNRHDAVKVMEKAGDDMKKKGVSLWVFPEGTRSSKAEPFLLPFKKGAFHLAVQAQVPIVPIVCENYHRLFDGRTRMERGVLKIRVLPPISTIGLTSDDVTSLATSTRESMLSTLQEISVPGPSTSKLSSSETSFSSTSKESFHTDELRRRTPAAQVNETSSSNAEFGETVSSEESEIKGSRLSMTESRDSRGGWESTEDEMDEDAVLLKRPKAA